MKRMIVTGSSGLIGGEVSRHFLSLGYQVHGIDNNMREFFFGAEASTLWNRTRLLEENSHYRHHDADLRDNEAVARIFEDVRPDAIVHAAAQPSHDRAAAIPLIDFDVNTRSTVSLLETCRSLVPESPFIFLSTNKVYGDLPNSLPMAEEQTRWEFCGVERGRGVDESMSIDSSLHSLFGVSKASADLYVQEYGRYFGMPTMTLRGGCLTGPTHSGVELHGFLSYLVKCNLMEKHYQVFGYQGKQVRDNVHSLDVAKLIELMINSPRSGEVYNVGGGYSNSVSIVEAMLQIERRTGKSTLWAYVEQARRGDHKVYYSDLTKVRSEFGWEPRIDLRAIFDELVEGWLVRQSKGFGRS